MCVTCGCSNAGVAVLVTADNHGLGDGRMHRHDDGQMHSHAHDDGHIHSHAHEDERVHSHAHENGLTHSHAHDEAQMHSHVVDETHRTRHAHADVQIHRHDDTLGDADDSEGQRSGFAQIDIPYQRASAAPSYLRGTSEARTVGLERAVIAKNDALGERNRAWLNERGIVALNLVSSPGSGKTTLLERTIRDLGVEIPMVVIEGDQATENDSARIRAAGARALQVNTGTGCHLEAEIVGRALDILAPLPNSVVMIENVGNLVCPALFDLGEHAKVAILSVTEGDDKPEKYPHMFAAAELFVINKIDLLPYVDFNVERCIAHARAVRPGITTIQLSARSGENLAAWYDWIRAKRLGADR